MLDISLNELLDNGRPLVIKGNDYFSSRDYVEPFLERTHNLVDHYNVHVEQPATMTKTIDEDTLDQGFTRVWVEGVMKPEYDFDGHNGVIGMVYGLDVRKPVAKFYKGALRCACTNLCVFNPEMLRIQELAAEKALDYRGLKSIIEYTDDTASYIQRLKETPFDKSNLNERLGSWIRRSIDLDFNAGFGKVKLSPTDVISAYKDMFVDKKSDYFVDTDADITLFDVYNAFTQQITDNKRDIVNRAEKTLVVKDILAI